MSSRRLDKFEEIQKKKQLLVEGATPKHFFSAWLKSLGLLEGVQVQNFGGFGELDGFLRAFAQQQAFKEVVDSVGIVRDAEDQIAEDAFKSVCSSLQHAKLGRPEKIGGFSAGLPRTGVFILPNCCDPGMLETICWSALEGDPKNKAHLECINSHLGCLGAAGIRPKNLTKAKIWTYLSGLAEFDPQVGRAAHNSKFDWQSPALAPLADFLRAL